VTVTKKRVVTISIYYSSCYFLAYSTTERQTVVAVASGELERM
jgi:hypothetical protein